MNVNKITVERLYANYDTLCRYEEEKTIKEHPGLYEQMIASAKGGEKEKKLASQFIARFFKHFPQFHYQAIDALFDMCEDDDIFIRKQAIKFLPSLCKDTKEYTGKVADVLAQLLQLEDPQEHTIATNSLLEVIKVDPIQALKGFFKQVLSGEYVVRQKCLKFFSNKIHSLGSEVITKEVEEYIVSEIKKIISDTTAEEFVPLMQYLTNTKYSQTPLGQQEIIGIATEQAELDAPFRPLDKENDNIDRLIVCIRFILPYCSAKYDPAKFVEYICENVLPQFNIISSLDRGEALQLTILRQLAELSSYCGQLKTPAVHVQHVLDMLKAYLPLPPENNVVTEFPAQDYTVVECLMYTFHKLARQCPEFLTSNADVLKDFRIRLQYFSRGVQGCIKTLKEGGDMKKDDDKTKKNAYKITTNINTLIKDLFYSPPSYKSVITLSWKLEETPKKTTDTKLTPGKRHAPITIDFDKNTPPNKQNRKSTDNVKIYTPPSGKFSNSFQNKNRPPIRGRGRGGGRGRGRGRGMWRN